MLEYFSLTNYTYFLSKKIKYYFLQNESNFYISLSWKLSNAIPSLFFWQKKTLFIKYYFFTR